MEIPGIQFFKPCLLPTDMTKNFCLLPMKPHPLFGHPLVAAVDAAELLQGLVGLDGCAETWVCGPRHRLKVFPCLSKSSSPGGKSGSKGLFPHTK